MERRERGRRTVEDLETGNGAPYAASPAVRGDGEDDGERCCAPEREAQLRRVARVHHFTHRSFLSSESPLQPSSLRVGNGLHV